MRTRLVVLVAVALTLGGCAATWHRDAKTGTTWRMRLATTEAVDLTLADGETSGTLAVRSDPDAEVVRIFGEGFAAGLAYAAKGAVAP